MLNYQKLAHSAQIGYCVFNQCFAVKSKMQKATNTLVQKKLEPHIKAHVLEYLRSRKRISENDLIISELTVDGYLRRADLVIVREDELIAIEIKSQFDSLKRLSGQTEKYSEFFDKVILVTTSNHIQNAMSKVCTNVEILLFDENSISVIRRGRKKIITNKISLLKMMTKRELSALAIKLGYSNESKTRELLTEFLNSRSIRAIRKEVFLNLKKRYCMTSEYFWKSVLEKPISIETVANLSVNNLTKKSKIKPNKDWLSGITDIFAEFKDN